MLAGLFQIDIYYIFNLKQNGLESYVRGLPPLISCIGPNKTIHLNITGDVFVDYEAIS